MTDEAQAAKEIAKAAQPLTRALGRLVDNLLGPASEQIGLEWGARVEAWRQRNAARVLERAQEKMRARELEGRTLPPRFLLPALERASAVDEPRLQELWAELIANGAAAEENQHPAFAQTLAGMNGADAAEFAVTISDDGDAGGFISTFADAREAPKPFGAEAIDAAAARLAALGLFRSEDVDPPESTIVRLTSSKGYRERVMIVTGYGWQFARAVGLLPAETSE